MGGRRIGGGDRWLFYNTIIVRYDEKHIGCIGVFADRRAWLLPVVIAGGYCRWLLPVVIAGVTSLGVCDVIRALACMCFSCEVVAPTRTNLIS
jgi:hypothetical protein